MLRAAALRHLSSRARFYGPVQQLVEKTIREALNPLHMEVTNESHGSIENESHFHVLVVADQFEGKRLLAKHRMVNDVFTGDGVELPFHALRITAKTPREWDADGAVPAAPKCSGGDGRGMAL